MPQPKDYTIQTRGLRTLPTLDDPKITAFLEEAKLRPALAKDIEERIVKARKWLAADRERKLRFERAPVRTLVELFPDLRDKLPKELLPGLGGDLDSACAQLPSGAYDACVFELLQRVAVWLGQSPTHRDEFSRNPTAAVDAVAGSAPREAIAITKAALDHAHRTR
jgi:hypothetical protein